MNSSPPVNDTSGVIGASLPQDSSNGATKVPQVTPAMDDLDLDAILDSIDIDHSLDDNSVNDDDGDGEGDGDFDTAAKAIETLSLDKDPAPDSGGVAEMSIKELKQAIAQAGLQSHTLGFCEKSS